MARISILTNHTRATQRAPLARPVSAALFNELLRLAVNSQSPRGKQVNRSATRSSRPERASGTAGKAPSSPGAARDTGYAQSSSPSNGGKPRPAANPQASEAYPSSESIPKKSASPQGSGQERKPAPFVPRIPSQRIAGGQQNPPSASRLAWGKLTQSSVTPRAPAASQAGQVRDTRSLEDSGSTDLQTASQKPAAPEGENTRAAGRMPPDMPEKSSQAEARPSYQQAPPPDSGANPAGSQTNPPAQPTLPDRVTQQPPRSASGTGSDFQVQIPLKPPADTPGPGPRNGANGTVKPAAQPQGAYPAPAPARDVSTALSSLLKQNDYLPAQTAVLGVSDDGLPVLVDLADPTPGALVAIGDERERQLNLLRSAIASLASRSTPRAMQFLIISCEPRAWQDWMSRQGYERFCLSIEGVDDLESLSAWILRLGDWTEQRRLGQRNGPPILVVLDTLSFLARLPYDIRLNFDWLAKEGPAAQIWPIAAISSDLALMLQSRHMLRSFPTRILGFSQNSSLYIQMANMPPEEAASFSKAGQFAVRVGDNWLRFHLPGQE